VRVGGNEPPTGTASDPIPTVARSGRVTARPTTDQSPAETSGLPACVDFEPVEASDGDAFDLRIAPMTKEY